MITRLKLKEVTSFDIVQKFAAQTFVLTNVQRCSNKKYNDILDFISLFASENTVCEIGYAIIAAVFIKNLLFAPSFFKSILIASQHVLLSRQYNLMLTNELQREMTHELIEIKKMWNVS